MKTLVTTLILVAAASLVVGQKKSVVIGSMISRPNAVLVISPPNSDQGFLLPQLSTAQRLTIGPSSPQDDGLMVFDLTEKSFYHWNNGAWVKGLGNQTSQTLSYDPITQRLTLTGGNVVDLTTLKEIPSMAGNGGKYLTTDGTSLSWATVAALGDISAINTSPTSGLSGGAATGDINLAVNTDGTTISVNGSNQLQLSNGAVSSAKLAPNAVNSSNIIDATVTTVDIQDNTISSNDLANGAVTNSKIGTGEVSPANIASGGNDKVLSTNGTGTVVWTDRSTFVDDNQNLSLTSNTLNIDNGTAADLNAVTTAGDVAGTLNSQVIQPGAVNSSKILDGTVATGDLASGGNDKVLSTNGTGTVVWTDRSTFVDDNQNLSLAANTLNIDNGTAADLNAVTTAGEVAGTLNNQVIQPNAVNSSKILDGTVATGDLASGGNDKVLSTNGTGTVVWTDRSTFVDDNQNLSLAANTLNIDNGTAADLNAVTTAGEVAGTLNNQVIQPNTVNSSKILDGTVATGDLASGGNDKVLSTNGTGTVVWTDRSTFVDDNQNLSLAANTLNIDNGTAADLNAVTTAGDVAGTLNNQVIQPNTVNSSKILDGTVATGDLASGGNDKVLSTNGTGTVVWTDRSTFVDDNQNLSLAANTLNIDNGTAADLNAVTTAGEVAGPLNNQVIQGNTVNSAKIADGSIATADIASGGNDKVLTTNGAGAVTWTDRTTFTDDNQTLSLVGSTLSIQDGNSVTLTAGGQVTGQINNLVVQQGTANQVMVTNGAGTATQWVTPAGDVTGSVTASTVARLQGRNLSNAAPNADDVLKWNGAAWVPSVVPAAPPAVQYLSVDPGGFVGLQVNNETDPALGISENGDGAFVYAQGPARTIMAAVNLPHGATINDIRIYYEYSLLLGAFQITLVRKPLVGGAQQILATINTPLLGLGIVSTNAGVASVVDNLNYSYRVIVNFTNLLNANNPGGALQRIHGARITYTK